MKKNKLIYLIFTLILTFSFNSNVYAAQELTCVYKKPWFSDKTVLIQYSSGERVIYSNSSSNAKISSPGWKVSQYTKINIDEIPQDSEGNLTKCPMYQDKLSDTYMQFFNDNALFREKIEKSYSYAAKLDVVELGKVENTTGEWLNQNTASVDDLDLNSDYTGSCKYTKTLYNEKMHIIQIDFGKENMLVTEYDPYKGEQSSLAHFDKTVTGGDFSSKSTQYVYEFKTDESFRLASFLEDNDGECQQGIMVNREHTTKHEFVMEGGATPDKTIESIITTVGGKDGELYYLTSVRGINPKTGKSLSINGYVTPQILTNDIKNCKDLLGKDIAGYLNTIWNIVKIGVPILLIGLGVLDFAQAVFSGKEDDMKKAQTKFIKRVIIAAAIFLIPTILSLLLNLAHNVWDNIGTDLCGIIF